MKKPLKNALKSTGFIVLFLFLFSIATNILIAKDVAEPDNFTVKVSGFKQEEKNSFDVMFYGNSHVFGSVNPLCIFQNSGITSYVYASPGQPFPITAHYVEESLKTQKPKVLMVEVYATTYETQYTKASRAHQALDPISFSLHKISMINDSAPQGERAQYYLPMIMFHGRWSSLTASDFDFDYKIATDFTKGYRIMEKITVVNRNFNFLDDTKQLAINTAHEASLNRIIELANKNDTHLVFFVSPFNLSERKYENLNYVKNIAQQNGIDFIDFNLLTDELSISSETDFFDDDHLNYKGAVKVSAYLSEYLAKNYDIADKRNTEISQEWKADYDEYLRFLSDNSSNEESLGNDL